MIVAPRPLFTWHLRTRTLALGQRTLVVGVVNITPDSFSDGGRFFSTHSATEHALRLLDEGADLLDLGGESTRPGPHPPISAQEELDRVLPVMEAVLRERPHTMLSIDTYKAETARAALAAGAEIVNDVSGFLWDDAMAATCAELHCGVVLMHTRGRPEQWRTQPPLAQSEVLSLVLSGLRECIYSALGAGVPSEKLVLDPGFGFGKIADENYPLLAQLDALHTLGYPVLAGPSRKAFLGNTLAEIHGIAVPPEQRGTATLAAITAAALAGAHLIRTHDVKPAREAVAIADAMRNSADEQ